MVRLENALEVPVVRILFVKVRYEVALLFKFGFQERALLNAF